VVDTIHQPLLVLDKDLRVLETNPAFYRAFQVRETETVGRLVYKLGNGQWDIPALRDLLERVLPERQSVSDFRVEHDFEQIGRRVMLLNARRLEAAPEPRLLLAINDITSIERARWEAEGQREYAQKVVDASRDALLILGWDLRVKEANETFYTKFKVIPGETEGCLVYELGNGQWNIPKLRELLETILPQNSAFDDFEVEHEFESIGRRYMMLNARRIDHMQLILLAIEDMTDRRVFERTLRQSNERLKRILETEAVGVLFLIWTGR
jgi:PAS domain-containing protein